MWIVLASSLVLLQFNRLISYGLLCVAVIWGVFNHVLDIQSMVILFVICAICYLKNECRNNEYISILSETLLVIISLLLALHVFPGFHNPRILDAVRVGEHSVPFSMYFNFDKALIPFLLIVCTGTLFTDGVFHKKDVWKWGALIISVPVLLSVAALSGGVKPESHSPEWLPQFMLANLFFVSLSEEALFRGYIQQRLSGVIKPTAALVAGAILFGLMHYSGGLLLVIFATLAGIIYGIAWMWSRRLWVSVLFHFGLNMCHLLFFTYPALQHPL